MCESTLRALEARRRAISDWLRTIKGVTVLAGQAGVEVEVDETACLAIILTAESYVYEYARKRRLDEVVEKTPAVQALARALFASGVVSR